MSNFGKRPLAYVCYLCGQQYGSQSLLIHIPQCAAKWCQQHNAAVPPAPPPELPSSADQLPHGSAAIASFNTSMSSAWQEAALTRCPHCNRTFRLEALAGHSKVCSAHKPFKPLPPKQPQEPSSNGSTHNKQQHSTSSHQIAASNKNSNQQQPKQPVQQLLPAKHAASPSANTPAAAARSAAGRATITPTTNKGSSSSSNAGTRSSSNNSNSARNEYSGSSSASAFGGGAGGGVAEGGGGFGPGRMPKAYVCYLCGQQYGSKSLLIHTPQCEAKWEQQQALQPPAARLQLPPRPAGLAGMLSGAEPLPTGAAGLQAFNDAAFEAYTRGSLEACKACGRTFRPEALAHHAKHCTSDRPMK